MLIDRYPPEDEFARVPELANQTDPVLLQLDRRRDDDDLYQQVRHDLARRYRLTMRPPISPPIAMLRSICFAT